MIKKKFSKKRYFSIISHLLKYLEITILGVIYFIGIIVGFLFSDNTFNSKVNNHNGLNEDLQMETRLTTFL